MSRRPSSRRLRAAATAASAAALSGLVLAAVAGTATGASASDVEVDVAGTLGSAPASTALVVVGPKRMTVTPGSAGWGFSSTADRLFDANVPGFGLWRDGTVTVPVDVPAKVGAAGGALTLRLGADQCRGGAHTTVAVDGADILDTTVDADLARYDLGTYAAGQHSVTVRYDGDTITADCDRALKVYTVAVHLPQDASLPALRFSAPSLLLDSPSTGYWHDTAAGAQVDMFRNGTASRDFTSPGATDARVVVTASGDDCGGQAVFDTTVDDVDLGRTTASATATDTVLPLGALSAGPHRVSVRYVNDTATSSCDRTLHLQRVSVLG